MSVYPIKVSSISLDHKNGTKSYHLMVVETADGTALFINRWGKTGQFGELQVKTCTKAEAWKAFEAKEREKTRGGYGAKGAMRVQEAVTGTDLPKAMTLAVFNKVGAKAINFIDPGFNTSGMRELDDPRTDEDGRVVNDTTRKADIAAQLEAQRLEEAAAAAQSYASNPNYGRF